MSPGRGGKKTNKAMVIGELSAVGSWGSVLQGVCSHRGEQLTQGARVMVGGGC